MTTRAISFLLANALATAVLLYAAGIVPPVTVRSAAEPMLLIAHRGDVANHPENTIESVVAAAELHADGVEMDVWRSASGTWWLMHDPTVDRTTNGAGLIGDLADVDVARLRVDGGLGYTPGSPTKRIPKLADALEALEGYALQIYVHLKETGEDAEISLGRVLAGSRAPGRITVIVPSENAAAAVKEADSRLSTLVLMDGLGIPTATRDVDGWLTNEGRVIRRDIVSARSYPVVVYADATDEIGEESESITRAYRFNVSAYITNDLAAAQATLAALVGTKD